MDLNGRVLSYRDLRSEVELRLASGNLHLPAELTRRDILAAATANGWIVPTEGALFRIIIPTNAELTERTQIAAAGA